MAVTLNKDLNLSRLAIQPRELIDFVLSDMPPLPRDVVVRFASMGKWGELLQQWRAVSQTQIREQLIAIREQLKRLKESLSPGGVGISTLATSTTSGTVKTNVTVVDPVVYLKATVDSLLAALEAELRADLTTIAGNGMVKVSQTFHAIQSTDYTIGGLVYGATASTLAMSAALTGILQGNGTSAPTAITGTANYLPRWKATADYLIDSAVSDDGTTVTARRQDFRTGAQSGNVSNLYLGGVVGPHNCWIYFDTDAGTPTAHIVKHTTIGAPDPPYDTFLDIVNLNGRINLWATSDLEIWTGYDSGAGTSTASWKFADTGTLTIVGTSKAIKANGDLTIQTTASNGHIYLTTHGTGKVAVNSLTSNRFVTSNGSNQLTSTDLYGGANTWTAANDFTGATITVPTPTTAAQAATKGYVDTVAVGWRVKEACRVATTAAGTLATDFENGDTIDGVVLATGDRILIKNQAAAADNGIYTINASGAPTRSTDMDSAAEVTVGAYTFITAGTVNAYSSYVQTLTVTTLGTDPQTYAQVFVAINYTAGAGITIAANAIAVDQTYGFVWTAAHYFQRITAATATVQNHLILDEQSTGTPVAGFGARLMYILESSTTTQQDAGAIDVQWTTATHASRTAVLSFSTVTNAGAIVEMMRLGEGLTVGASPTDPGSGVINAITGFRVNGLAASKNVLRGNATNFVSSASAALTKTDDTNVTLTLGGTPTTALLDAASLTLGWTGTLAASRLNSNVVQSITNDTNVTGSIAAQVMTLGWTGFLSVARGGTGLDTWTVNGILYASAATTLANSSSLTWNGSVVSVTGALNTSGNIRVGSAGAVTTAWGIQMSSTLYGSSLNQIGVYITPTCDAVTLVNFYGTRIQMLTPASAFCIVNDLVHVEMIGITQGAFSVINNAYGLRIQNITQGGTSNYAIYTNTGQIRFGDQTNIIAGLSVGTATTMPTGVVNASVGYRVANAATSGNYLRGDGANFVSNTIQAADITAALGLGVSLLVATTAGGALTTTLPNVNATLFLAGPANGNPAAAPTFRGMNLSDIPDLGGGGLTGDLPFANLAQGAALSVLGVTGNATADVASIAAGSDHQVLRRSGTSVAFGAVNLASANAVTDKLATTNGGTNNTAFSSGKLVYSSDGSKLESISNLAWVTDQLHIGLAMRIADGSINYGATPRIQIYSDRVHLPGVHIFGDNYLNFFYNGEPDGTKQTVSGSRGGNAALASLLTALANYGLITDSTSA